MNKSDGSEIDPNVGYTQFILPPEFVEYARFKQRWVPEWLWNLVSEEPQDPNTDYSGR